MSVLLNLVVKPELEDMVTDWLLMHKDVQGFSSHKIRGHGSLFALSLSEQVTGMQKQVLFICILDKQVITAVLELLKQDFADAHLRYWISPVMEHGTL